MDLVARAITQNCNILILREKKWTWSDLEEEEPIKGGRVRAKGMERKSGMKIEEEKSTSFFICVLLSELVRYRSGRNVDWLRCHRWCYPPLLNEFNIWFSLLFLALNSLQCHLAAASLSIHLVLSPMSLAETRYWRTGLSYKWGTQLFSFIFIFLHFERKKNFSRLLHDGKYKISTSEF